MDTVATLARFANSHLYRDKGRDVVLPQRDCPEWVTDLFRKAHGDMLPDDWRYEFIQDALTALGDELEDCPDVDSLYPYTSDRLRWLASHLDRSSYCDMAQTEYGITGGVLDLIAAGMGHELEEVYQTVKQVLEERCEDTEE